MKNEVFCVTKGEVLGAHSRRCPRPGGRRSLSGLQSRPGHAPEGCPAPSHRLAGNGGFGGGHSGVISGEFGVIARWISGASHLHLVGLPDDPQGFVHIGVLGTVLDQDHLHPCPFLGGAPGPLRADTPHKNHPGAPPGHFWGSWSC